MINRNNIKLVKIRLRTINTMKRNTLLKLVIIIELAIDKNYKNMVTN